MRNSPAPLPVLLPFHRRATCGFGSSRSIVSRHLAQRLFRGTLIPGKRLTLAHTLSLTFTGNLFPFSR